MTNPYASPDDADADLFGDANTQPKKHSARGICPDCGVPHLMGADLPDEFDEHFERFLETLPGHIRASIVAVPSNKNKIDPNTPYGFIDSFMTFADQIFSVFSSSPLIKAVVVVLDEMTDGRISRLENIYKMEYTIHRTHRLLKSVNRFSDALHGTPDAPTNPSEEIASASAYLLQFLTERLDEMNEYYIQACIAEGFTQDQKLLDTGEFDPDVSTKWAEQLFVTPLNEFIETL